MSIETATEPGFGNVQRQMRSLMDQMKKNFFNFCPSETWEPNVNLYEIENAYVVCVDLAGVDKDRIDVVVADGRLQLRGTRAVPAPADLEAALTPGIGGSHGPKVRIHVMEIDHGPFCREVDVPENVDKERISATHRNGLLWIELPKAG
ncbi:MAG TPA: Hsp20/alpha crystallin family protein [Tepidisphaeraceae bacterium]|nr:Hsp20/alpha crystallin family protein [Tepidisphaeraceae bacterium]